MAKVRREEVVAAGLALLDEVGLDAFTTRLLARRLKIESATLYWHFRDKAGLLGEMAAAALARHHTIGVPPETDRWLEWFADNVRSFRRALLSHRDGARLHAGTTPNQDEMVRLAPKVAYLVRAGLSEHEALMALLAASQFTIGCVLEEQVRAEQAKTIPKVVVAPQMAMEADLRHAAIIASVTTGRDSVAFEFGLTLLLDGLRHRMEGERQVGALGANIRSHPTKENHKERQV